MYNNDDCHDNYAKFRALNRPKLCQFCLPCPPGPPGPTDALSAFRAIKEDLQPFIANTENKILFEIEEFDTNNDYDPLTSTFIPNQSGIYTIHASYSILASAALPSITTEIFIRVNSITRSASENTAVANDGLLAVSATAILNLNAGDTVEVFMSSNDNGVIVGTDIPGYTNFQAVRIQD